MLSYNFQSIPSPVDAQNSQRMKRRKIDSKSNRKSLRSRAMQKDVELTSVEAMLRRVLLDVAASIEKQPELRFAGGWVRDKVRGEDSNDIDVAISSMTGQEFALQMRDYLDKPGVLANYEAVNNKVVVERKDVLGGLHKIVANPEKSKHLETVTTKMLGLDIDLVNLRKETYTDQSRNPQMEFGSPQEDALRRDATVNALFYNLQTSTIEDFTGLGLHDIEHKIIRTPLSPYRTFIDDPLRVLRLIRFASRFGYEVDQETEQAMKDSSIKAALKAKVTRERVWKELEKMLRGGDPCKALRLIDRLELYNTIFTNPNKSDCGLANTDLWERSYNGLQDLIGSDPSARPEADICQATVRSILIRSPEELYLSWLLAALVPWVRYEGQSPSAAGSKASPPAAATVVREGLRADNKVVRVVQGAITHARHISLLKEEIAYAQAEGAELGMGPPRDVLGMAVRRWGHDWRSHAVLALLIELGDVPDTKHDRARVFAGFATFLSRLKELNLLDANILKPIVGGKQIAESLFAKDGPWLKCALDMIMTPRMNTLDELRKEARDVVARGGSALSLEDDRLHTIRRDISLVIVRNILIEGDLIKNFANLESLIVAEACLQGSDSTPLEEDDKTALSDLYDWISSFVLPGDEFASSTLESKSARKKAELARICSAVAIRVLVLLNSVLPISKHTKPQAVIVSLAAFTDGRDPWVAAEACHTAAGLLQAYLDDMKQTEGGFPSVVGAVLKDHTRPLFAKSKNPAITSQGRKNIRTVQAGYDSTIVDPESKPWKYRYPYLVSVFRWILEIIDAALVEENWPLIIPPLLTIIDDDSTDYKTKGCELMTILLRITRSSTLARTGLGEVFENAVLPYLAYLPSLTPEEESLQLLDAAYPALISLARTRFPGHIAIDARRKHLDKIVRQGILKGYYHAKEHVKITELLVGQITVLVDEMGIWAAKHLKDLLPLLSDVLCAPFGTAYPPLLLAAVKATQSLIISCWPRMTIYRGEVLRGLVMCWCKVEGDSPEGSDTIKAALKDTIKLLTAALGDALVTEADHDNLVHGDERLSELFKTIA